MCLTPHRLKSYFAVGSTSCSRWTLGKEPSVDLQEALTAAASFTSGGDRQGDPERRGKLQDALKSVRETMRRLLPEHPTKHGEGQVIPSEIPYVCVFPANQTGNDPKS